MLCLYNNHKNFNMDEKFNLPNECLIDDEEAKKIKTQGDITPPPTVPTTPESPKEDACKGKKRGDACSWTYNGVTYNGHCRWLELAIEPTLYCSDRQGREDGE